ncbi:hypothetical protein Q4485_00250 [Granulosicoccaceae sp. 1_MG-2023]|nr:hypothetical protein [Granulosicoccaceae sp. 1_MG-2023]
MTYLISEIALFIAAAALLGLGVGWMIRSIGVKDSFNKQQQAYEERILAQEKLHRQEVTEFAESAKKNRAEVSRLETNNKALRETIEQNTQALSLAQTEVARLRERLEKSEHVLREIEALENGDPSVIGDEEVSEFDETIAEQTRMVSDAGGQDHALTNDETLDLPDATMAQTIAEDSSNDRSVELSMSGLWSNIRSFVGKPEKK